MHYGSRASWNVCGGHLFETPQHLLRHYGPTSKGIVWADNSHVGDSVATDMGARGEINIGNLRRREFGSRGFSIGLDTDRAAAAVSNCDERMQITALRPAMAGSYEPHCRQTGVSDCLLSLKQLDPALERKESAQRLGRAIGVICRPDTENQSHDFQAQSPRRLDECIWLDGTLAVGSLPTPAFAAFLAPIRSGSSGP